MNGVVGQIVFAGPGAVVHAEQMQQRRLAGARRPHDGDELAFLHFRVDAAQHKRLGRTVLEILLHVPQNDQGGTHTCIYIMTVARGSAPIPNRDRKGVGQCKIEERFDKTCREIGQRST